MTTMEWNAKGHAARGEGRWPDAVAAFTAMIAAAEAQQHWHWRKVAYICRGLCHRQLANTLQAITDFTDVGDFPNPARAAFYYRGNAMLAAGRFDDAEADHRSFAAMPDPGTFPFEPVFNYPQDVTLAEADCSAAIDAGNARPATFFSRACVRELQRRFPSAIADYEAASADPLLAPATAKALARARKEALGVRPGERDLMQPGVEYCCVTYDPFQGPEGVSHIKYYDLHSFRTESHAGGPGAEWDSQGWAFSTGVSDKEGSTSYFYRIKPE